MTTYVPSPLTDPKPSHEPHPVFRDDRGDIWVQVGADEAVLIDDAMLDRIGWKFGSCSLDDVKRLYELKELT